MREEKKYEILPGVEIPDIKKIQEAASDFSISEVGDVDIKNVTYEPIESHVTPSVSPEELARLQALGVKVAEDEERSKAESKAKMEKIMKNVSAPESIGNLKASHMAELDEAKRKQVEEQMKEANKQQAEEDAKTAAREERKILQQRILEESRAKAEAELAAKQAAEKAAKIAEAKAAREAAEKAAKEAAEKAAKEAAEKAEREAKEAQERAAREEEERKAQAIKEREAKVQAAKEAAQRAAKEALEKAANAAAVKAKEESDKKEPVRPIWETKKTTTTLSAEETNDAFKEFLDEGDDF